ncbi:winged helix DNA-binding domain-containing protein [Lentzea sp. NPDC004782]|uniref:winged helix DNA-binding domain-containing protein n=1 Tax=Lentzea sp. NPDC004782 TaxID=3154458 RepID=UPI0033B83742
MTAAFTRLTRKAITVLDRRAINRATLARQLLLRRHDLSVLEATEQLVGLQAQLPFPPYIGLWARLEDFDRDELSKLILDRQIVRSSLMRYTMHLVTTPDLLWLRPLLQPVLDRAQKGFFGRETQGLDLGEIAAHGRKLLNGKALTQVQLREAMSERFPGRDPLSLAYSVQYLVPLVHVPPWGKGGSVPSTLAEPFVDGKFAKEADPKRLVRRYLAAFGPATVKDLQAFSGLTFMAKVFKEMGDELEVLTADTGQELYDLPGAPRPDGDTPAPVRFLPEYDNLMVSHFDRSRVMDDDIRKKVCVGAGIAATLLVDGFVRGIWKLKEQKKTATLTLTLFKPLSKKDLKAVEKEADGVLRFAAPDATTRELVVG